MRKRRPLPTQERLKELFDYDPETGVFTRRVGRRKWKAGQVAGTPSRDGYISINVDYVVYRAHRLAWMYVTGTDPEGLGIDHVNGTRNDNRFDNLRLSTQSENLSNRTHQTNSKAGMKGVYFSRQAQKYGACINFQGKRHFLGFFHDPESAKSAYDGAIARVHGLFGRS